MKTLFDAILPAHALGIEVAGWDGHCVELTAPLDRNLNDKGTAFAGSIDAMLDLAGWSAATMALRDAGIKAKVMIVKGETNYHAGVTKDMSAICGISGDEKERMLRELSATGRSRIALLCRLSSNGEVCASMQAHYAIVTEESP